MNNNESCHKTSINWGIKTCEKLLYKKVNILKKYINFFKDCSNYYISIAKNEFQQVHIKRKIEHCKRVNKLSIEIAEKLGLDAEEVYLVSIASLFHDIGRFKQFYEYSTYIDKVSCNHVARLVP